MATVSECFFGSSKALDVVLVRLHGYAINRLMQVQILAVALSSATLGTVVYTHVPSSIIGVSRWALKARWWGGNRGPGGK